MEASKVSEQLKYIAQSGVTLSVEERMQLECALSTLQSSMSFETLYLWGKINGKWSNYSCNHNNSLSMISSRNWNRLLHRRWTEHPRKERLPTTYFLLVPAYHLVIQLIIASQDSVGCRFRANSDHVHRRERETACESRWFLRPSSSRRRLSRLLITARQWNYRTRETQLCRWIYWAPVLDCASRLLQKKYIGLRTA